MSYQNNGWQAKLPVVEWLMSISGHHIFTYEEAGPKMGVMQQILVQYPSRKTLILLDGNAMLWLTI